MMAKGVTLPSFIAKMVISASLRSPFSSNWMLPEAPLKLIAASAGRYLAGSVESAFFIASIISIAAS